MQIISCRDIVNLIELFESYTEEEVQEEINNILLSSSFVDKQQTTPTTLDSERLVSKKK